MLEHKFIVLLWRVAASKARRLARLLKRSCRKMSREMIATRSDPGHELARVKTAGFYTWSETDITAFEAEHLVGSKARLALGPVAPHRAGARGFIRMGKQHVRDGGAHRAPAEEPAGPCIQNLQAVLDVVPAKPS